MEWASVRLLAIGAHQDDMDICAGGTIAKCARNGGQAIMVDLVAGSPVSAGFAASRQLTREEAVEITRAEALESAAELGAERIFLGADIEPPWGVPDELAWKRELVQLVRKFRPNVVLTTNFNDHHPDHRRVVSCVIEVCTGLAAWADVLPELEPFAVPYSAIYLGEEGTTGPLFPEVEPNTFIDVTETISAKLRALRAFRSQKLIVEELRDLDSPEALVAHSLARATSPRTSYPGCVPTFVALNEWLAFKTGGDLQSTHYVEAFLGLKAGRSGAREWFPE